jgi:rhodanese-related sulfurtransferase
MMHTNLKVLLAKANESIPSISATEAKNELHNENFVFIDVREKLELTSDGEIPGAIHIPRGMLEFNLDANSPYYKEVFDLDKNFIFVCKSGGRSALAAKTASDMGLQNVINMSGGILEWNK